jgi:hypothetical protein
MFENRGSPAKQDDLEEELRQILSEQETRKRIEPINWVGQVMPAELNLL